MWALDALADEPERLEGESAEAGDIDTIKIELARARAEDKLPSSLHGYAAWARGSAEREGLRVTFEGGVSFSDQEPARRIETRAKFSLDEGGTLRVAVRPSEWFRKAEFDRIAEAAEGAPRVISSTDQVGRAFQIGARSPLAFEVSWKTSED